MYLSSPAALVRSQHFSGVADEFAEKTRSTGMTLTIGLARSIGLAIVRLGVAASLRALLVACRAGRASESIARSSRCTWPEMARDGARWREMGRDGGGPHGGAWAWCRHAKAWHTHGACVHLPRDGEVARVLPAREHLLPRGFGLGLGLGLGFGFGFGFGFGLGVP